MLKVAKFGGSSMANAGQFAKIKAIIESDPSRMVVVVSAAGKSFKEDHKVTDLLYLCHAHIRYGVSAEPIWEQVRQKYLAIREECGLSTDIESAMDAIWNKMQSGIDEDELYSLARDGKWTIDEMQRVASYVPENPTGTGIYRYDNADAIGLLFSSGLKITNFDEEDAPYIVDALPVEFLDLSQITVGMFADNSQTPTADYRKGEDKMTKYGVDEDYDWFQDNKALFQFSGTGGAISLRQFDVVFGILPMPKGSASQAQYYSYADPWGSGSLTIPKTTKNIDVTSTITEAMGALSAKYVKTAYYDMLLRGQSIFDMESRDMLDIIFQTTVYDMVDIYSGGDVNQWGPLMQALSYDMTYDNTSITSNWKSNVKVTKYTIKNIIKTADNQD